MAAGRRKIGVAFAVVFFSVALALFAGGAWYGYQYMEESARLTSMRTAVERDVFYDNITIDGIDVSGMSYNDALRAVETQNASKAAQMQLVISFENSRWPIDAQTLNVQFNTVDIVNEAYALCRDGDLQTRYEQIEALRSQGAVFTTEYTLQTEAVDTIIDEINAAAYIEPQDATVVSFDASSKRFVFSDEQQGREGDAEAAISEAKRRIEQREFDGEPILVSTRAIQPEITKAALEKANKKLSSATTTAKKDSNRDSNITLSMAAINNAVIMPGETFSFNDTTGKRTAEKGYKEAGTIKNGVLIPELGGGVCQVSTTLFNAVAKAGLQIVERKPHSWPSTYVDIGKDAMVDYPGSDLKFINNTNGPIFILANFAEQKLVIDVYGMSILEDGVTLVLRSETTETIPMPDKIIKEDLTLDPGKEVTDRDGRKGYRATTYTDYVKDGVVIKSEVLHNSYYRPIAPIIRINPNAPLPTPIPSVESNEDFD